MWMIVTIWPHYRWAALAQVSYLIWVTTATVQLSIMAMTGRNEPRSVSACAVLDLRSKIQRWLKSEPT